MTSIWAPLRPTRTRNRFTSCSASAGGVRLSQTSPAGGAPVRCRLGLGGRVPALEDIPRVEDEVDGPLFDEVREMVEHSLQLVEALNPLPSAADMPVAGVDDLH